MNIFIGVRYTSIFYYMVLTLSITRNGNKVKGGTLEIDIDTAKKRKIATNHETQAENKMAEHPKKVLRTPGWPTSLELLNLWFK